MKYFIKETDHAVIELSNITNVALVVNSAKGPTSEPIIFKSISDVMNYIKQFNKK